MFRDMRSIGQLMNLLNQPTHALLVGKSRGCSDLFVDTAKNSSIEGPMLNALANHNILPHDGRSISFRTLNTVVRQSFNFAPSFCFFVPHFAADFLDRSYWSDTFDLEELSKHNEIEHDASLTRRDAAHEPNQGKPDIELVEQLLGSATGGSEDSRVLTRKDLSAILSRRRAECRLSNSNYSETFFHKGFGSAKYVTPAPSSRCTTSTLMDHVALRRCLRSLAAALRI